MAHTDAEKMMIEFIISDSSDMRETLRIINSRSFEMDIHLTMQELFSRSLQHHPRELRPLVSGATMSKGFTALEKELIFRALLSLKGDSQGTPSWTSLDEQLCASLLTKLNASK